MAVRLGQSLAIIDALRNLVPVVVAAGEQWPSVSRSRCADHPALRVTERGKAQSAEISQQNRPSTSGR